jgi:cytochrome P450
VATDAGEVLTALFGPEGRADPYPHYSALHELGEAVEAPGAVVVAGYDAVNMVLRDPLFTVADQADFDREIAGWREHPSLADFMLSILNTSSPDHARMRGVMARAFTPRRVAALEPAIAGLTDALLEDMAARGAAGEPVEFMHDFAFLLPVTVICELLGIPAADRERFRPLARDLAATLEPADLSVLADADAAAITVREYFTELCAQRRARPRDDLVSVLVEVSDADSAQLSGDELLANLMLLLVAGFETTTNLLGNGLRIVLDEPWVKRELAGGGLPVGQFVAEVLRYDSPVQLTSRRPAAAAQVGGVTAAPGVEVVTLLGAANRDPRRFGAPNRFHPARYGPAGPDSPPVSFGAGAHFCLGAALARLEGAVAFPRLLARFPALAPAGHPVRRPGLVLRGYETLPVRVA